MSVRTQLKESPLPALAAIAASPQALRMKRGIAAYYAFLQFAYSGPSPIDAYNSVLALEAAAAEFMDPSAYT